MPEPKTKPTKVSVNAFLKKVADVQQRADALVLLEMMQEISGQPAVMWGPSIIGFGQYHYKYDSGHEGDCGLLGFSPRKGNLVVYFLPGLVRFESYLKKLGKYKTGKVCLYIKRLSDIDVDVLREMLITNLAMLGEPEQQNKRAEPIRDASKKRRGKVSSERR